MAQNTTTEKPLTPLSLEEVGMALIKHCGLHEGLYDVAIEFQFAVGQVGPSRESVYPGAMLGVSRIGLAKAEQKGPHTVDAREVNPAKAVPKKTEPKEAVRTKASPKKPVIAKRS